MSGAEDTSSSPVQQSQSTSNSEGEDHIESVATVGEDRERNEACHKREPHILPNTETCKMFPKPDEHVEDALTGDLVEGAPSEHYIEEEWNIEDSEGISSFSNIPIPCEEEMLNELRSCRTDPEDESHQFEEEEYPPENLIDNPSSLTEGKVDGDTKGPYVPMCVEEVSVVTSLKHWSNLNVRVIGKVVATEFSTFFLHGIGKDQGNVCLNLENLDQYPKHGDIVEAFAKVYVDQHAASLNLDGHATSKIRLKVMFFRPVLDFVLWKKTLSLVKPYIPLFVRRYSE